MYRERKTEARRSAYQRPPEGTYAAPHLAARPRVVRVPGGFAFVGDEPAARPGHATNDRGVAMGRAAVQRRFWGGCRPKDTVSLRSRTLSKGRTRAQDYRDARRRGL